MAAAAALSASAAGTAYGQEAPAFSVVYTFNGGTDGAFVSPAPLSVDRVGNIHGTTGEGGDLCADGPPNGGCGVVFTVAPSGSVTTLYSFTAFSYYAPGVISAPNGDLYGVTSNGGSSGLGSVFKLTPAGTETTQYSFSCATYGCLPYGGVIRDTKGNLYGTTIEGGDVTACGGYGCGVVFKLDPSGNETVLHTFEGPTPGQGPQSNLLRDGKAICTAPRIREPYSN